jgi:hypothetical protein
MNDAIMLRPDLLMLHTLLGRFEDHLVVYKRLNEDDLEYIHAVAEMVEGEVRRL